MRPARRLAGRRLERVSRLRAGRELAGDLVPGDRPGEDGAGAPGAPAPAGELPATVGRLRAAVLGPRGGGTTRRRASDLVRLGAAVVAVAISVPIMRANSAVELAIVHALIVPPPAIRWLVTTVFWLGSAGVVACLALLGLLVPRLAAVSRIALAAALTWGTCAILPVVLGPAAGRPGIPALAGTDTHFPVTLLAITVSVAATALPYLSRAVRRLVSSLITITVIAAVVNGAALPVDAVSSLAIGWGIAAAVHLAVGSPLGLPSADEVAQGIADLRVTVTAISRARRQAWGLERFTGRDAAGRSVELAVYGRDAADARILAKLWRFCFYRDSGPNLIVGRTQLVEHEAYLTITAGRAGVLVPGVLAVGRFGPSGDAAIVTVLPDGPALADAGPETVSDETLDEILEAALRLRRAGIAHGALGLDTILLSDRGVCVRDFRSASSFAPAGRLDADLAAVLAAMAVRAGVARSAAAAARVLDGDTARGTLVHLQHAALDPLTIGALRGHKGLLPELRAAVAGAVGIEVPKLAEAKRVSWVNLAFGIATVVGLWAIIGVLGDVAGALYVIKGARWGWTALAFVLAELPVVANAWVLIGSVTGQLPFGRCIALETSNTFTSLAGGDLAVFAVRVRFFQRQGYDAGTALSSGAIASTASWVAKGVFFLAAIGFAAGSFRVPSGSGGRHTALWVVVGAVIAAGLTLGLVTVIPRLRRLASVHVRPHLVKIWADLKTIAAEPRKIVYVLAGSALSQLFVIFALGAALHAVGQRSAFSTLVVVNATASLIGGAVPVPGGAGVVEAGLIAGLTAAGVPQDQAVAAVFIQRLFTAYLPPIWGWATLAWMRRREYV